MQEITQFFQVTSTLKTGVIDITKDIMEGLKLEDEDGLIKKLNFDMVEGFTNMDKLARGQVIDMWGGDLNHKIHLFNGKITEIQPDFADTGEVYLGVVCQSGEGGSLARVGRDLVYPSKNHPESWGRSETTYSQIIMHLARKAGFGVINKNIAVIRDIPATFKNPVRQSNKTDWTFMQELASDIRCTLWTKKVNGKDQIFLKDNSHLVNTISDKTFYYLARTHRSDFINMAYGNPKMIKMESVTINLESNKSIIKQSINPETGKTEITAKTGSEEEGQPVERWILDEVKVRALPSEIRRDLINSFIEGKVEWEASEPGMVSAKPYFKLVTEDESSRVGKNNNIEVEVSDDNPEVSANGITTTNGTKEQTGSRTYKTVIDVAKVRGLSSEQRSAVMGRIARGQMTEEDRKYYTVVDTTPKPEKEEPIKKTKETPKEDEKKKKKDKKERDKRDAGFKIEALIYGRPDIATKTSHVLEGLGKYSNTYYLYRTIHTWGNKGWEITVTFVK